MLCIENLILENAKIYQERYYTYYSAETSSGNIAFEVYLNPTSEELHKFIKDTARGFIDIRGNLYMEGLDTKGYEEVSKDREPVHQELFDAIYSKDPSILGMNKKTSMIEYSKDKWIDMYGVTVQRSKDSIYLGEFISDELNEKTKANVLRYFALAQRKNPSLSFIYKTIPSELQ